MIAIVRKLIALGTVFVGSGVAMAQPAREFFAIGDAEIERLGVELGVAEPAERVQLAAAPATLVVPPQRQALVSAPQAGIVARLFAAEGDVVAAGQPVAEIDSVKHLERQRDYLDAVATAELAAAQEARDRRLFDEGVIAERRVAEASVAARAAQAALDQARAQLELSGFARVAIDRLAASRQLTARLVLRAPLAGTVVAVHGGVGGHVDALAPVLGVADLGELWLEARLPQETAAAVSVGMEAVVALPAGAERRGTVTAVGGVVDAATQTVLVRAAIDNADGAFRGGQVVTARILASAESGTWSVPIAALTRHGSETLLFVHNGTEVRVQPVAVLGEDGARAYLGGELTPRDRIAVSGVSALKALWLAGGGEGG